MAPLSTNTVNLRLNGTVLTGSHQDGKPLAGSIDLNQFISNTEGCLTWGGHGFYTDAREVKLYGTRLYAELKNPAGQYISTSLDIDQLFQNRNGILEPVLVDLNGQKNIDPTPKADATSFSANAHFIDRMASSMSPQALSTVQHSSATTPSMKHTMSASYKVLEGNCRFTRVEGKTFHAECLSDDGIFKHSKLNFESHIYKLARNIHLDGLTIRYEAFHEFVEKWIEVIIDLNYHLRIYNGSLVVHVPFLNRSPSEMLSTASWLDLQLVAKPNFAKLASSAWAQEFMGTVAPTIVEDTIRNMKEFINSSVGKALEEETRAAVSMKLSEMVKNKVRAQASAELSMSLTDSDMLRVMTQMNGLGMMGLQASA